MRPRSYSTLESSKYTVPPQAGSSKWSVLLLAFWIANVAIFLFYLAKFGLATS